MVRHRRAPRRADGAVSSLVRGLQPVTALGEVQRAWPQVAGAALAGQATPTRCEGGKVTLTCRSAVAAQELTLMAAVLVEAFERELGRGVVSEIRCRAARPRGWGGRP